MEKNKLFSGRYFLTIVAGVLMLYGTIAGVFPADKVLDIIKDIVIFYFVVKQITDKEKT
jgi:hypothetical protein